MTDIETEAALRGLEFAVGNSTDFEGDSDEAYGGRVFLHHYCVHLAGHARRWRQDIGAIETEQLGRRIARRTLLAVAGLVCVHDATWTSDRELAAIR